ncbi:hypothetical protein CEQ30_40590 [Nocardia brasiliensis]|nr:hypothetical protein CEQ30_40590 [Nocardia brasiliensis]
MLGAVGFRGRGRARGFRGRGRARGFRGRERARGSRPGPSQRFEAGARFRTRGRLGSVSKSHARLPSSVYLPRELPG